MSLTDLLMQGVELMGLGMGIVFFFLVLLVFMMQGMSWLAHRIGGKDVYHEEPMATSGVPAQAAADADLIAVIGAAVHRYRTRRR